MATSGTDRAHPRCIQSDRASHRRKPGSGNLKSLLPPRRRLTHGHHAAMPSALVPSFVATLRARPSVSALALEFAILCAARSGEVFGAPWEEIDQERRLWISPAGRMKGAREHRVPLGDRAMDILLSLHRAPSLGAPSAYVFTGARAGPLSTMAMEMVLRRMSIDYMVHGFRSSFRDWAAGETNVAREVAEAALAHAVGDEVERAYRRGDALQKRRQLMADREKYVDNDGRQESLAVKGGARATEAHFVGPVGGAGG